MREYQLDYDLVEKKKSYIVAESKEKAKKKVKAKYPTKMIRNLKIKLIATLI